MDRNVNTQAHLNEQEARAALGGTTLQIRTTTPLQKLRQATLIGASATPVGRIAIGLPLKRAVLDVEPMASVKATPRGFVPLIAGRALPALPGITFEPLATATDAWLAIASHVERRA